MSTISPAWDELDPPRTVYVPRLIETVEQAEALPIGTVAHRAVIGGPARYAATRTPSNDWYIGGREFQDHDFMIGWTALVPAEVYEGPGGHGPSWYIQADEYDR